jgi:hypothetical protein
MKPEKMRVVILIASLFTLVSAATGAEQAGVWTWGERSSAYFAGTSNAGGDTFGQACYPNESRCYWVLGLKRSCRTDAAYPVLINTDAGASTFRVTCKGQSGDKGLYEYAINQFEDIDSIVSSAAKLGVALPLQGDQFLVVTFDLGGSKAAVTAMRKAVDAKIQERGGR